MLRSVLGFLGNIGLMIGMYVAFFGPMVLGAVVGSATSGTLGWITVLGLYVLIVAVFLFFKLRPVRRKVTGVQPNNHGDTPTALWITQRGMASGYHQTDKLTPDGLLCGYAHDDFDPAMRCTYAVVIPRETVAAIFARLASPELTSLQGRYQQLGVWDGFVLELRWRLGGTEHAAMIQNVSHPVLSPLVAQVWSHAPAEQRRVLPDLPPPPGPDELRRWGLPGPPN